MKILSIILGVVLSLSSFAAESKPIRTGAFIIDTQQLRELIIRPTLKEMGAWSPAAEELLLGTLAQESDMGRYIKQLGGGPALGVYQMEPATYFDIWDNYLAFEPDLREYVQAHIPAKYDYATTGLDSLIYDLKFATIMARIHYLRVSEPLPEAHDVEGLAQYWKKHYNTHLGKGTTDKFVASYHKHVVTKPTTYTA